MMKKYSLRERVPAALLLVGIIWRFKFYMEGRSLWLDEAALAIQIIRRSFREIIYGINDFLIPTAPPGFLLLEKTVVAFVGNSEYTLRAFPMIFAVLGLGAFCSLLRQFDFKGSIAALGLMAFSGPLIFYSATLKVYSLDVFVTIVFLLFARRIQKKENVFIEIILFGVAGALALWFSYTAMFVLPGIGLVLGLFSLKRGQTKKVIFLVWVAGLWASSLFALYIIQLQWLGRSVEMRDMHTLGFLPRPVFSLESLVWLTHSFLNLFHYIFESFWAYLAAGFFLLGGLQIVRRDYEVFILLLSPIVLVMTAAVLQVYPFYGRFILFLTPVVAIFVGEGIARIACKARNFSTVIMLVLVAALFFCPPTKVDARLPGSQKREDMRKIMSYLKNHYRDGEEVYLNNSAQYAYIYYYIYHGFDSKSVFVSKIADSFRKKPEFVPHEDIEYRQWNFDGKRCYFLEAPIDKRPGILTAGENGTESRVWLIFAHARQPHKKEILNYFNANGERLDEYRADGASLYLYAF